MDDVRLPASILLYVTGASFVVGVLVNGVRTAVVLPAIVSFLGACLLGFVFVVLFALANGVTMTLPLWAASVIAGVLVGGGSAGANAVHSRSLPTTTPPTPDADPPVVIGPTVDEIADELERRRDERVAARLHAARGDTAPGALITRPPGWLPPGHGTAERQGSVWPPTTTAAEREGR